MLDADACYCRHIAGLPDALRLLPAASDAFDLQRHDIATPLACAKSCYLICLPPGAATLPLLHDIATKMPRRQHVCRLRRYKMMPRHGALLAQGSAHMRYAICLRDAASL